MKQRQNPAQSGAGASGVRPAGAPAGEAEVRSAQPAERGIRSVLAAAVLLLALSGCTHKTHWVPPPMLTAPVDLDVLPEPADPPVIASLPPPEWSPPEPAEPPKRPVRRRPAPAPARDATPAPPTQVASAPELAIGSLSTGGDTTPQTQQQARDLIAAIQKRIAALPRSISGPQKPQIRQVVSFLKRAQQALDSGDADGAMTLATKARLIMDDIEKK